MRALLAVALILAGCSSGPATPEPFSLEGTSWIARTIDGVPPAPGQEIRVAVEGNRVSGTTGCNSWGGELVVRADGLHVVAGGMTAAACADPGPAKIESLVTDILFKEPLLLADPQTLVLRLEGREIVYARVQ